MHATDTAVFRENSPGAAYPTSKTSRRTVAAGEPKSKTPACLDLGTARSQSLLGKRGLSLPTHHRPHSIMKLTT